MVWGGGVRVVLKLYSDFGFAFFPGSFVDVIFGCGLCLYFFACVFLLFVVGWVPIGFVGACVVFSGCFVFFVVGVCFCWVGFGDCRC